MNILLKKFAINLTLLQGAVITDLLIAEDEKTGKKLTVDVIVRRDGKTDVLYSVFDKADTVQINTSNIIDAINRYNFIGSESIKEENSSL